MEAEDEGGQVGGEKLVEEIGEGVVVGAAEGKWCFYVVVIPLFVVCRCYILALMQNISMDDVCEDLSKYVSLREVFDYGNW